MHKYIDYTGAVINHIKVISAAPDKITTNPDGSKRKTHMWNCLCECGNEFVRQASTIKKGNKCVKCVQGIGEKEKKRERLKIVWKGMKNRCYDEKHSSYKNYGGRGIEICEEWLNNFQSFKNWALNNGYTDGLTIDRKDTDGNYEPLNCRWATKKAQQANRRDNRRRLFEGEMLTASQIAERTGNSYASEYLKIWRLEKQQEI